jgi:hypothetical protein
MESFIGFQRFIKELPNIVRYIVLSVLIFSSGWKNNIIALSDKSFEKKNLLVTPKEEKFKISIVIFGSKQEKSCI